MTVSDKAYEQRVRYALKRIGYALVSDRRINKDGIMSAKWLSEDTRQDFDPPLRKTDRVWWGHKYMVYDTYADNLIIGHYDTIDEAFQAAMERHNV